MATRGQARRPAAASADIGGLPPLKAAPVPSTASTGFFQGAPTIPNQFREDTSVQAASRLFLPSAIRSTIASELDAFADQVLSPEVQRLLSNAESHPPYVQSNDLFGRRVDHLITSEGWRGLQAIGQREGMVGAGHEHRYGSSRRVHQFLKYHLWSGSCATTTCPSAMTDGAAAVLKTHIARLRREGSTAPEVNMLEDAVSRLTSRDPAVAWTSGQWMTERTGGSDVRGTETRATYAPAEAPRPPTGYGAGLVGDWSIDGFKWFSSATDADMTLLLAKAGDSDSVSLFIAPVKLYGPAGKDQQGRVPYNGVQIQRLKSKLGTRALPTAELVLCGMRAHMLGQPGKGTREIATMLNITRMHNSMSAMGSWGRGLAISRAYSRVRKVNGGKLLVDTPAHVRGLAEQHVQYRAYTLFSFFVANLLGIAEQTSLYGDVESSVSKDPTVHPTTSTTVQMLRVLTPVLKATTALKAIEGLRFCMESLGGVGYLEDPADPLLNVARLYRDANVLSIWEGTTDVLGHDTVRALAGSSPTDGPLQVLTRWVCEAVEGWRKVTQDDRMQNMAGAIFSAVNVVCTEVGSASNREELLYGARDTMFAIARIVCSVLLVEEALRSGNEVSWEIANRWIGQRGDHAPASSGSDWQQKAALDRFIVFGQIEKGTGQARL